MKQIYCNTICTKPTAAIRHQTPNKARSKHVTTSETIRTGCVTSMTIITFHKEGHISLEVETQYK